MFVMSGPSGSGKSTLARRLLESIPGLSFSVSFTTRARREGEKNEVDYHFVDDATFDRMVDEGAFLEWARVHDRRYGTGRAVTREALNKADLLLDVDVQGAEQIREADVDMVSIFILPPDYETLEQRLRGRQSEAAAQLEGRLAVARQELEEYRHYDYLVINDDLGRAFVEIDAIVRAERRRRERCAGDAERVLGTLPR
ncbi:hypothetical protein ABI59_04705 [Acidobacteria bacterium Mor1]|nr:hypothetical protein ABI59_04705 [Acidobacteria bacterium Mor1]